MHLFVYFPVLSKVGSVRPALPAADLGCRLYQMAATMTESNEIKAIVSNRTDVIDDLPGLLNDLKIRLEGSFNFTKEQKVSAGVASILRPVIF